MTRHVLESFQKRSGKALPRALASLWLVLALPANALQVDGRLDSDSIRIGELVQLVLEMDGKPADLPDLSVLAQDFRILGRQSRSSRSVVNGQRLERHQLVLTLAPLRAGLLEIPPIRIGDASTAPLQLAVGHGPANDVVQSPPIEIPDAAPHATPAQSIKPTTQPPVDSDTATDALVLLEASIEPSEVRVAQQAVLVARILMPKPVSGPILHEPVVGSARLLPLGEDWDQVQRDNISYQVYERRYAVFPQQSGLLEIPPLIFEGWVPGVAQSGNPAQPQPVHANSEPLTLKVISAAKVPAGASWLPARNLSLDETGPEIVQIQVGQPLERAIDIRAEGLAAADLPGLMLSTPYQLEQQRVWGGQWDEHTPDGVIGIRRERIRLTANEPGRYSLPSPSLSWWDSDSSEWKTASLPARDLIVLPVSADAPISPPLFEPVDSRDTWTESTTAESPRTKPAPPRKSAPEQQASTAGGGFWLWATVALVVVWLLTMAAWWGNRRRAGEASRSRHAARPEPSSVQTRASAEPEDPLAEAIDEVRRAYESGDAGVAREALLAWADLAISDQPPGNLALLAKRCREPLRGEILLLEQAFFSPSPLHWERRRVWERLSRFEPVPVQEPASFRRKKPLRRRNPTPDRPS